VRRGRDKSRIRKGSGKGKEATRIVVRMMMADPLECGGSTHISQL
jgi:hypothetical protein